MVVLYKGKFRKLCRSKRKKKLMENRNKKLNS